MKAYDVIAYTADADHWCRECALATFGDPDDESTRDSEGNGVGAVFGDSEWYEPEEPGTQVLSCSDCGMELDTYEGEGG